MPESRRESAVITSVIENILCSYPAGNPILREILQNSDDAGAREQVRPGNSCSLFDPPLIYFLSRSFWTADPILQHPFLTQN